MQQSIIHSQQKIAQLEDMVGVWEWSQVLE